MANPNNVIYSNCALCGKEMTVLVRLKDSETQTRNLTRVCTNPKCTMFIDLKKVKTWIVKGAQGFEPFVSPPMTNPFHGGRQTWKIPNRERVKKFISGRQ